jgi:ATP-dependent DNA ligase
MLGFGQEPMLARPVRDIPHEGALPGGSLYEPKFDGYRALLFVMDGRCRVQSRRGHDITDAFSDVAAAVEQQVPDGVIIDGELVVWGDGALDFAELQRRLASRKLVSRKPASFMAFDVLAISGSDVVSWPLYRRREALELLLQDAKPPIQISPQTDSLHDAEQWMRDYAETPVGVEGVVIKGRDTVYSPGKREWLKLRIRDTVEVIVGAVTGSLNEPRRLVLGLYRDGVLEVVGSTGELTRQQRSVTKPLLNPAPVTHPWPDDLSEGKLGHFGKQRILITKVEPTLVVEVSADSAFEHGRWRHITKFIRPRPDLTPDELA